MAQPIDIKRWKKLADYDINQAASEFADLLKGDACKFAEELGVAYISNFISNLNSDVAVAVLRNFPEELQDEIFLRLSSEKVSFLKEILSYPEGSAGSIMAKEFYSVPLKATIREAVEYIQLLPQDIKARISYIYVVDEEQRLEGVIQIRDLIFHPPNKEIRDILKSPVVQVEAEMSQYDVALLLQRHRYLGIPVVDSEQRIIGVVNADNVLEVFQEDADKNIAEIVGTSAEEIKTHSIKRIISLRLPWLIISLASGLLCAYILGLFRNNLETITLLFLFVPVVLGISESTGIQGATIVIRNIALGNRSFNNLLPLLFREVAVGIIIGLICGSFVGVVASYWQGDYMLGVALASSMMAAVIISALIGLVMPVLFMKLEVDTVFATGPFVLAICDIQTLIVYFSIASMILKA